MEHLFDRKQATARRSKHVIRRIGVIPSLVTIAWLVAASATGASAGAASTAAAHAQTSPQGNASASSESYDVAVTAPSPPTDEELAGGSLPQFVAQHATVALFQYGRNRRNVARWIGGKRSICPLTKGLSPEQNAYVTARIRALAAYVGAPVQPGPQCEYNVTIQFTNNPHDEMDKVFKWATVYFLNRYSGGKRDLIKFTSDHAIQGWYLMGGGLNSDLGLAALDVLPIWPRSPSITPPVAL